MPFVAIDHTTAFAIDAPIKASHIQTVDQNIDDHESRIVTVEALIPITEASISWASAGGISQSQILSREILRTSGGNSWGPSDEAGGFHQIKIYIPANANSIEWMARVKVGAGGYSGSVRISQTSGGAAAMQQSTTSTSYVWLAAQTESVSAVSGWVTFYVESASSTSSGTDDIYVDSIVYRII